MSKSKESEGVEIADLPLAGRKILVVENEPGMIIAMETLFKDDEGVELFISQTGEEASEIIKNQGNQKLDLIISDQGLDGEMTGSDIAVIAKKEGIPFILWTNILDAESLIKKDELLIYVDKMCSLDKLVNLCAGLIQKSGSAS